jgi:hypothetical protein
MLIVFLVFGTLLVGLSAGHWVGKHAERERQRYALERIAGCNLNRCEACRETATNALGGN